MSMPGGSLEARYLSSKKLKKQIMLSMPTCVGPCAQTAAMLPNISLRVLLPCCPPIAKESLVPCSSEVMGPNWLRQSCVAQCGEVCGKGVGCVMWWWAMGVVVSLASVGIHKPAPASEKA